MRRVFLYRSFEAEGLSVELDAAQNAGFVLVTDRDEIRAGDVVLPRFYPFYNYLADELSERGAVLLNVQHDWVSDIREWFPVLGSLTPMTWNSVDEVIASGYDGSFFVKGIDKSMKVDFERFCFARDLESLPVTIANLVEALPVEQPIVIRAFERLASYGVSPVSGMPISHEFRCFVYNGVLLTSGFYWDAVRRQGDIDVVYPDPPMTFIEAAIAAVGDRVSFYSLDVALTERGEWIVIEVNDGVLSGLSANDPVMLYSQLAALI